MFGRGVIATIYGWALEQAGHNVTFYVRPGRAAAYGEAVDLDVLDSRRRPGGRRITQTWAVRYLEALEPDHDFDLIILSVAHHRLPEAAQFLAPRLSKATVLIFSNIWSEPMDVIDPLPVSRVAWGFPQGGGQFGEDGVLHGGLLPGVIFGTLGQPPTDRELAVRQMFRTAGFPIHERPDFRGWLWLHFVADAGLHSQALRLGSLSNLVGKTGDLREAILTIGELLPLIEARGVDLRQHRDGVLPFLVPAWLTAPALSWLLAHVRPVRLSFETHSDPHAEEPRVVCRDTLAEARRLGVAVPRLEAAERYFAREATA